MCSSRSRKEAALLGYPSAASIARALDTWVGMHAWSLTIIVEASAHIDGGVDRTLEDQRVMLFVLSPRDRDPGDPDNPADAFVLEFGGMTTNDWAFLRSNWPHLQQTCKTMADAKRGTLNGAERRAFVGFIPAAFYLKSTGIVAFHSYPLFRLRAHGSGPSYKHPIVTKNNAMFRTIVKCWGNLMNRGLVLRTRHKNYDEPRLETGQCVRYGKWWVWLPTTVKWDSDSDPSLQISTTEFYKPYHKLLVRRNFERVPSSAFLWDPA